MSGRGPSVLATLALTVAGAGLLAGCGDDDGGPTTAGPTPTFRVPATTNATPIPTTPSDTDTSRGGTSGGSGGSGRQSGSGGSSPASPPRSDGGLTPPSGDPAPRAPRSSTVERPKEPVFCPAQQRLKGSRAVDRFDARQLLGLETAKATALARRHGCALRVTVRDGRDLARTLDFSNSRINVTETDGRVVRLNGVG